MDLAPIINGIGLIAASSQTLVVLAAVLLVAALFYVSTFGRKLREVLSEMMFSNWRLALLGATGLVLSLASGWTTWDGMRNFTQEPLLSLMITFGIQGVMLIVAWLIGESFATGMNAPIRASAEGDHARRGRPSMQLLQPATGTIIGILMFVAVAVLILNQAGIDDDQKRGLMRGDWAAFSNQLLFASFGILLVAMLILNAGGDVRQDYGRAFKVIVRSAVLWVMFLACMATSVFFSFDSLFSTIFPAQERERAAVLRAQNQVAGVVNDIGSLAVRRRIEEQDALFQRAGWKRYEETLDTLTRVAREAPGQLEAYFERKMREKQKVVSERQEEKASAEGQQVRLAQRKGIAISEIGRIKERIGPLVAEVERFKALVFEKDREIIAKNAEAEAEAGGIGATSKVGRGPKFREIANDLRRLQEQKKNLQLQLGAFEKRLDGARNSIATHESELRTIDGQLAQLKGRAQTAGQLIEMAQQSQRQDAPQFDPTNGLRQLERARIAFRQNPTQAGLANIQGLCTTLVGAMTGVPTLKDRARSIDCDPGMASEAAARVFALNTGILALNQNCIGGGKLPQGGGADSLFKFARGCVQDAGLPSADTEKLRTKINYLELNRDDKAHRFVVTSNAFQDGNKLAYLALAIAIAIDALVFMSGLFGANAVRSVLVHDGGRGLSAQQLEAVIDTALHPHTYDTARYVLNSLRPITPIDGYSAEVFIDEHDHHAGDMRRVLNAGASIDKVREVPAPQAGYRAYQIRSELSTYLAIVIKRETEKNKGHSKLAELEKKLTIALLPNVGAGAEMVKSHCHPMQEHNGFMAEIFLNEINDDEKRIVRSALAVGAMYERAQRVGSDPTHFFIHSDFYDALLTIRGRLLMSGRQQPRIAPPKQPPIPLSATAPQSQLAASAEHTRQINGPSGTTSPRATEIQPATAVNFDPDELRSAYRDGLLQAMGIDPVVAEQRLSDPAVHEASSQAWAALRGHGEANPLLNRFLREHWKARDKDLSDQFTLLRNRIGADEERRKILYEANEEVDNCLPALVMFPESGLLDYLIQQLEAAAELDNGQLPGEQEFKNGLIHVRDAFMQKDWSLAEAWQELAHAIKRIPHDGNVITLKDNDHKNRRSMG